MHVLLEVQRRFADAVRTGDCGEAADLIAPGAIAAADAIGIYRNTFIAAATRALKLSYPVVERLTGAEFFEQAAFAFISGSPPRSGCLDDYGEGFAEFLAALESTAGLPYLHDVARMEWAVNIALHAADALALDGESFAAAAGISPDRLVLSPHPSLSLLKMEFPADTIWSAVLARNDAELSSLTLGGGPFFVLVERDTDGVQASRIAQLAWEFLCALSAGRTFAQAFGSAPSADLPSLLAECIAHGRFTAFRET